MKKIYLTLIALATFTFCKAQYVTIPDTNFVKWLQVNPVLKGCMNGNQLDTTCAAVLNKKTINCDSSKITDLTGIQYFKSLDSLICFYNSISIIGKLPDSLRYLDCHQNQLILITALPDSLIYLNCSENELDSLPPLSSTLYNLDCSDNQLVSLPVLPASLFQLNCALNKLTVLPVLPASLYTLNCSANQLANLPFLDSLHILVCSDNPLYVLPDLPSTLASLDCDNDQLDSVPQLPFALNDLSCSGNYITRLPPLPANLYSLECSNNLLTALPVLTPQLSQLDCSDNSLHTLPVLPNSLRNLNCSNDVLTRLPAVLPSLNSLDCSINLLDSLPSLPSSIYQLNCNYNKLAQLPALPSSLQLFNCSNNKLSSLPSIPALIEELWCGYNNISNLPPLPPVMTGLHVDSNALLSCIQPFSILENFSSVGTNIHCLPNRIQHPDFLTVPELDSLPLCDLFNVNGCPVAWNIEGTTYFDTANTCDTSIAVPAIGKIKLMLFDSTGLNLLQQVITNGDGSFSFNSGFGQFILKADTSGTPFHVLCPGTGTLQYNITPGTPLFHGANFRLVCKNGYDLGVNSINYTSGKFFPGRSSTINIQAGDMATYYGVSCNTSGLAGTVTAVISGPVTISSASGNAIITGNTITWNVPDFSQTNFATAFSLVLNTDTSATAGQTACINTTISAGSGTDNNPSNNNLNQCFNIVTSHDPNLKEVCPSIISYPGQWVTYTIHFQNTGTAPAENIFVLDTLNIHLDISTIQVLSTSHKAFIQVLPGRIVRFNFPEILLPDSITGKDSSNGFVQFRIRTTSDINYEIDIKNTASVYFDYNAPVKTNTTICYLGITGVNKTIDGNGHLQVFPNPTNGVVHIVTTARSPLGNHEEMLVSVTDMLGREVMRNALTDKQTTINMSGLAAGVYYIRVSNANETQTMKVVKE